MNQQTNTLLYYTEDYPKLVEMVARQCYQSFGKVSDTSHSFIRSIMSKGHLSVASVGNIVFGLAVVDEEVMISLLKMKEINNFIRWTITPNQSDSKFKAVISMNMLSFLDIKNEVDAGQEIPLFDTLKELVDQAPDLSWFYDRDTVVPTKQNGYTLMPEPNFYAPVLLSEDYTHLKKLGLTEAELFIHATVTINYMTDRSTGLQLWRHGDMTGGTELSQRYVNRGNAQFRDLIGFESDMASDQLLAPISQKVSSLFGQANEQYNLLLEELDSLGVHQARAKEVARSILPNAIATHIIQCRPLRQWQHLFNLRDSSHAQNEAAADVRSIKQLFSENEITIR